MSKQDYHGKGEQDARDDEYEKPHGVLDDLTTWSKEGQERIERENEEYDKGYHHGKGQQDASEGEQHPPHGFLDELTTWSKEGLEKNKRENDAYDAGHDSTSKQKSGGVCFLTTACTEAAGLPDDCTELTVLRRFRDDYVAQQPGGWSLIREYYQTAPLIVEHIQRSAQRADTLGGILSDVRTTVGFVQRGEHESALRCYQEMFTRLKQDLLGS
jgi:hypothetical protein